MDFVACFWRFAACGAVFCAALAGTAAVAVAGDVFVPPPVPLNSNAASDSGDDANVQVFSDGAGRLLAVWKSTDDLSGTIGTGTYLLYAWSDDQGETWSAPKLLSSDAETDYPYHRLNEFKQFDIGEWYATWFAMRPAQHDLEDWSFRGWIARSTDNGETWGEPLQFSGGFDVRTVATDGRGTWLSVSDRQKKDKDGPYCDDGDIFVSRSVDEQTTWNDYTPVNNDAATDQCTGVIGEGWSDDDERPSIFYVSGAWVVVWQRRKLDSHDQPVGVRFLVATSRNGGRTWSDPSEVPRPRLGEGGPPLQVERFYSLPLPIRFLAVTSDRWCMLWWGCVTLGHDEGGLIASVTTDGGASWSSTLVFTDHGTDYSMPRGPLLEPEVHFHPTITAGTSDDLLVTWSMGRHVDDQLPDSHQLFAARSADHGCTWSEPVKISTDAVSGPTWDSPSVGGDGGDKYVVVWPSIGDPNSATGAGPVLIAFSDDKGATWTDPTPFDSNAEGDTVVNGSWPSGILSIGAGQWLGAWSGSLGGTYGSDEDILLTRLAYPDRNQNGVPDECDPGPEPNNPPDDDDQPADNGSDNQPVDNGDSGPPSTDGQDAQPGEGETPPESRPALPCAAPPLAGVALLLLVRNSRLGRASQRE